VYLANTLAFPAPPLTLARNVCTGTNVPHRRAGVPTRVESHHGSWYRRRIHIYQDLRPGHSIPGNRACL